MKIKRAHQHDVREVRLSLGGVLPEHRLPSGTRPIAVSSVEMRFDIPTRELKVIEVFGHYIDPRDESRRSRTAQGTGIRRCVYGTWSSAPREVPEWLVELVEKFRPPSAAPTDGDGPRTTPRRTEP